MFRWIMFTSCAVASSVIAGHACSKSGFTTENANEYTVSEENSFPLHTRTVNVDAAPSHVAVLVSKPLAQKSPLPG